MGMTVEINIGSSSSYFLPDCTVIFKCGCFNGSNLYISISDALECHTKENFFWVL